MALTWLALLSGFQVTVCDARPVFAPVPAGLRAAGRFSEAGHVVLTTVNTPDIPSAAVARVLARAKACPSGLARAAASAHGDLGLRDYLTNNLSALVDCGDVATGEDIDVAQARAHAARPAEPSFPIT